MEKNEEMLSKRKIFVYGLGGLSESISYNLFYIFFIFFLTSVAGLSPGVAGTVSLIAVFWSAVTDPIVGYLSDKYKGGKLGKRSPFILFGAIPLGILVFALFCDVNLSPDIKAIYFISINVAFWLFLSLSDIPYIALAPELTDDYDTRTKLRASTMTFMNIAVMLIATGVLKFLDYLSGLGIEEAVSWRYIGGSLGFITAASFIIVALYFRKKELSTLLNTKNVIVPAARINIFKEARSLIKLKQYRLVIYIALLNNLIVGCQTSVMIYFYMYSCKFNNSQIVSLQFWALLLYCFMAVFVGYFTTKTDKKTGILLSMTLLIVGSAMAALLPHTYPIIFVAYCIFLLGNTGYWTIIFPMIYDLGELDELVNGTRRDGIMVSVNSFVGKLGVSLGMWLTGMGLELVNFNPDAEVMPANVGIATMILYAGLPAVLAVITLIPCALYKIDKKRFAFLQSALKAKKAGEAYDSKGLEELI